MQARIGEAVPGAGEQPPHYDDLALTLAECWRLWDVGARDRRSAFHSPFCATIGRDGRPRARVVTLRESDPAARLLRFNLDLRSEKFHELRADARIALTGYDAEAKIQIRAEGRATLHVDDAIAEAAWQGARPMSRVAYGQEPGPGTRLPGGGAYRLPVTDEEIAAGRASFAIARIHVERFDWVYLAHGGHRRAAFAFLASGVEAAWLAP